VSERQPECFSSPLLQCCTELLSRYSKNWPPSENDLAMEFVSQFQVYPLLSREQIETLCFQLGIDVSFRVLSSNLPGHNCFYENKMAIELNEEEIAFGSMTHTVFHEIRELMERIFTDLEHPTISGNELEERAESFAAAVRMNCTLETLRYLTDGIADISSDLLRWGSYALVCLGLLIHGIGCAALPQYEDSIARGK